MSKFEVIENIKKNILENKLNDKVETDDPNLTEEKIDELINNFYKLRKNKIKYAADKKIVETMIKEATKDTYNNIEIKGIENIKDIQDGAIITGIHFNPMDTLPYKKLIKEVYGKEVWIVSVASNLDLQPPLNYVVNHQNIIPLKNSIEYLTKEFKPRLYELLKNKEYVVIYPEENMWFNYRKPRPCKRGAYTFAAEANKPIISCFTELVDLNVSDDEEFNKVKYILHILKPIYPDKDKTVRQNSIDMANIDYEQKKNAYEKIYNKKLDYVFNYDDIAGLKKKD